MKKEKNESVFEEIVNSLESAAKVLPPQVQASLQQQIKKNDQIILDERVLSLSEDRYNLNRQIAKKDSLMTAELKELRFAHNSNSLASELDLDEQQLLNLINYHVAQMENKEILIQYEILERQHELILKLDKRISELDKEINDYAAPRPNQKPPVTLLKITIAIVGVVALACILVFLALEFGQDKVEPSLRIVYNVSEMIEALLVGSGALIASLAYLFSTQRRPRPDLDREAPNL